MTPMMRQYLEMKAQHPDAILFFRLGDFYEMFFEDAELASRLLNITLTTRNRNEPHPIPFCGVPHHTADGYIAKLASEGYKVAICEQVEDPSGSKPIFERRVVRIVTPGLVYDPESVSAKESCYLVSFCSSRGRFGLAVLDLTTAEFRVTEVDSERSFLDELSRIDPREVIGPESEGASFDLLHRLLGNISLNKVSDTSYEFQRARQHLLKQLNTSSLVGFGCGEMKLAIQAAGALASYVQEHQREGVDHIRELKTYFPGENLILDHIALRHLEIVEPVVGSDREGVLLHFLDQTRTAMGGRLLRRWLCYPLRSVVQINRRLDVVEELQREVGIRNYLEEQLGRIYDLERLSTRLSMGNGNARDLVAIRQSLARVRGIRETLRELPVPLLQEIVQRIDPLEDLQDLLSRAVTEDPPTSVREGGMIREGYHTELDDLRRVRRGGKEWIAKLEGEERKRTGIASLKVGYNKVFGYYIEVTKPNLHRVPPDYIRKQTLTNAERFITSPLKEYEEKVLHAEEKILSLEHRLFLELRDQVRMKLSQLLSTAHAIAEIDVLLSFSKISLRSGYVRPKVDECDEIVIEEGRHPVLESLKEIGPYVPNSVRLNTTEEQILIVTGPNMAGKSTVIRQTALIVILAQIGCYVPAKSARIGLVDRIFSRVGAMDRLSRGESTFMVEMSEVANILRHATPRSLVLLDEVGRGTSTFDGISIAWAVVEYLHNQVGAKTLFATHYHELAELPKVLSRVRNWTVAVREWNDQIIFLHKLIPGAASHSYGIQVAELAGLPPPLIRRSKEILRDLESGSLAQKVEAAERKGGNQPSLFESEVERWWRALQEVDPDTMTPMEALQRIQQWKTNLK